MTLRAITKRERDQLRVNQAPIHLGALSRALALVLHERTGWDLVAVAGGSGLEHFGVRDGEGRYRDVRGVLTKDGFREGSFGEVVVVGPEHVRGEGADWDRQVDRATKLAGLLFRDLPGVDPWQARLEGFAAGLEKLCRETGVWIRPDGWAGIPIYENVDGGDGFEIAFDELGGARLHRVLAPAGQPKTNDPESSRND